MNARPHRLLIAGACLAASAAATAHTGTDGALHHGFATGLAHPFTGIDHLIAMLAVGFASGVRGRGHSSVAWAAPLAFAAALLIGALATAAGLGLPAIEPVVAASLLAFGLAIAMPGEVTLRVAVPIAAAFGVFHGAAHAQELAGADAFAGMLTGSIALLGLGFAGATATRLRREPWVRGVATLTSALGFALLAASLARV